MIAEQAYLELYPEAKLGEYSFSLLYSGKFSGYNARVWKTGREIRFSLSRKWERISDDVKIGLMQHLLNRLLKTKVPTTNQELYHLFLKKVHIAIPKTQNDPLLEASFNRMNEQFFLGTLERPNLVWGGDAFRKLGHYEYGTDTILMSGILREASQQLLDYVMYHEMLHKKHKFHASFGRTMHHPKAFRDDEKKYPNFEAMEHQLTQLARKQRRKNRFFSF